MFQNVKPVTPNLLYSDVCNTTVGVVMRVTSVTSENHPQKLFCNGGKIKMKEAK